MTDIWRSEQLREKRIGEFQDFGVWPDYGQCLGQIVLGAGDAEKVLRMLRRLKKLEQREQQIA